MATGVAGITIGDPALLSDLPTAFLRLSDSWAALELLAAAGETRASLEAVVGSAAALGSLVSAGLGSADLSSLLAAAALLAEPFFPDEPGVACKHMEAALNTQPPAATHYQATAV